MTADNRERPATSIPTVRRIVTGETPDGKSVFTHVEEIAPLEFPDRPHRAWYGIWGWDEVPTLPYYNPDPYVPRSGFPRSAPPGAGMRITANVFPPSFVASKRTKPSPEVEEFIHSHGEVGDERVREEVVKWVTSWSGSEEWARLYAAEPRGGNPADPETGLFNTDSIDLGFVVAGELCVEQHDGATVTLRPGDVYIQNGAMHKVYNPADEPALAIFVVIGTTRDREEG